MATTTTTAPTVDAIRRDAEERGIEFYFAQFVDMYARPSAKLIPAGNLDDLVTDGAGFAGFAAGEIGQLPSDPDIAAIPDLHSYTPVPWQPNLARFACDITVEGEEWPYDPRTILRRQLERARQRGFEFMMGLELEYFLVRPVQMHGDGNQRVEKIEVADPLDTLEKPCYDLKGLTRNYEFLTTVSRYVNQLGWGNYANDHEDANGQFEQNFTYTDALTSCDRAIFFRYMVHTLAQQRGLLATFMPKPFSHLTGNGCHFHMSLWDGDTNLFLDENDPRGLGLSETAYHFIGGLKRHAKAYIAVTAPTVNSYKRLRVGAPTSGATWSPVYVTYGYNNRTQMLRIPGPGRVEDRTIDGSCNPYLAATVVLAAGLDGIENRLDPGDPNPGNLYEASEEELKRRGVELLPANLLDATRELEQDAVIREALGRGRDEDYVDYFIRVKRSEWTQYHEQVTPWEIDQYLTRF
jgi:glutamine synthetase